MVFPTHKPHLILTFFSRSLLIAVLTDKESGWGIFFSSFSPLSSGCLFSHAGFYLPPVSFLCQVESVFHILIFPFSSVRIPPDKGFGLFAPACLFFFFFFVVVVIVFVFPFRISFFFFLLKCLFICYCCYFFYKLFPKKKRFVLPQKQFLCVTCVTRRITHTHTHTPHHLYWHSVVVPLFFCFFVSVFVFFVELFFFNHCLFT